MSQSTVISDFEGNLWLEFAHSELEPDDCFVKLPGFPGGRWLFVDPCNLLI